MIVAKTLQTQTTVNRSNTIYACVSKSSFAQMTAIAGQISTTRKKSNQSTTHEQVRYLR